MNHIVELNLEEGWVLVQPGVVLDQLNDALRPYGKFFAPTLSPSSRATLGGMVNTDASGKGSRLYGKTSQHVLAIQAVYPDGQIHTSEEIDIANLWELRKRSVGLLGKVKGARKPTSGVEDTVVPPEHLADYVREFRAILDKHGLEYGMFGHIDVGCLHVRPAYNLMDEKDRQIYYEVTEQVAELTKKYGGVLWGEHGKGFRSEYVPLFFGEKLYEELRKIKASCDPQNQLNPGKIAVPFGFDGELVNIRSDKLRANADRQIAPNYLAPYYLPISCNSFTCFLRRPHRCCGRVLTTNHLIPLGMA